MTLVKHSALPLFELPDELSFYSQLLQSVPGDSDGINHIETGHVDGPANYLFRVGDIEAT